MKVAWVHSFPPEPESSGIFMHLLAEEVARRGVEIKMVYTGSLRRPDRLLFGGSRLTRAVSGCDLMHAQFGSGCGYVASHLTGRKVLSLRGSDWYGTPPQGLADRVHGILSRRLTRSSLSKYQLIIVMSERMKQAVAEVRPAAWIEVLPDGLDLQQFQPMARSEARALLGAGDDTSPWILFSSVLDNNPVKRIPLATAAFRLLRRRVPDVKLKVLTGRPHGDVPTWINASDVVLLTSAHEGWPNIVKEALACNVPFVSTDVSDLRSIAEVDATCHVADATPEALAHYLLQTLQAGRPQTLRRHVEDMALPITAEKLVRLYERVVAITG